MELAHAILQHLLGVEFILLYIFIGSALWVHYRGRVRHRFSRQLTDHSTFLAPVNAFMYAFSAIQNRAYLDPDDFDGLAPLRENWEVIRDEALALQAGGRVRASDSYDDLGFNSFFRRGWKRFYLTWYDDPLPSAEAACPQTLALLYGIPGLKAAMFAMLPPGAVLVKHRDPYAGSVRYHLGLSCPPDDRCFLEVDGERYSWRDGQHVVFDETLIHHAENHADTERLILFCDIERPMKYAWAQAVNRWIGAKLMVLAATKNEPGENVGVLNRLFGVLYPIRKQFKALKRANRRAYYAVKYVAFVGLAALIFL